MYAVMHFVCTKCMRQIRNIEREIICLCGTSVVVVVYTILESKKKMEMRDKHALVISNVKLTDELKLILECIFQLVNSK